jgi:hypothetical protein
VDERLPPPDITPVNFFDSWLPAAYLAAGCQAPEESWTVLVTLSGEAGGLWELEPEAYRLEVRALASAGGQARAARMAPPRGNVWLRQSAPDFLAALVGDPDLPRLMPDYLGPLDMLFLDPRDRELLRQIDGRLLLEVLGRRQRRWTLDLAVGKAGFCAGRPRSTLRIDAASYEGLRDGSLPPLQALLERKLSVEGDRTLAMQALMLLATRLTRRR